LPLKPLTDPKSKILTGAWQQKYPRGQMLREGLLSLASCNVHPMDIELKYLLIKKDNMIKYLMIHYYSLPQSNGKLCFGTPETIPAPQNYLPYSG